MALLSRKKGRQHRAAKGRREPSRADAGEHTHEQPGGLVTSTLNYNVKFKINRLSAIIKLVDFRMRTESCRLQHTQRLINKYDI